MNAHLKWAVVVAVLDRMTFDEHSSSDVLDPPAQLQRLTRNRLSSLGPTEHFSEKLPTLPHEISKADLRPIDVLYGSYDSESRRIEIYVKAIDRDKRLYGASFDDFLYIVRLHEYAHAITHLGLRHERSDTTLFSMSEAGTTDWDQFLATRLITYSDIDESSHEFLAQALTYAVILSLEEESRERIRNVFHRLEAHQPCQYRIPPDSLPFIGRAHWDVVLDAARGDFDTLREADFVLRHGLEELVCFTGGKEPPEVRPEQEWVAQIEDDLAETLKQALNADDPQPPQGENFTELLVDRYGGLRIEVFAREHPPPHFRVLCGSDAANYRIDDCQQINGGLRVHYRTIRRWHEANRANLIGAWNRHRPSDCPVGEFRGAV